MQLLIQQRVFSWSDTYDIYDEQGNQKYFVKNELISLGHRLHVYDAAHNEIGFIKQKLFCLLPTFEIEWNGQLMGHIEQRFALFRPKYDVDFMGWRAEGDFMGWDYDVYEACSAVVHVHKKILSWGDTYAIEFDDPKHEIPALLLVLARKGHFHGRDFCCAKLDKGYQITENRHPFRQGTGNLAESVRAQRPAECGARA